MPQTKRLYYLALLALALFEIANVWFLMPLPFSQRVRSVDVAYALHRWRWPIRVALGALAALGLAAAWRGRWWRRAFVPLAAALVAAIAYATNVAMSADHIFLAPRTLVMAPPERNHVAPNRLVVGVTLGGEARAYPVQFIAYHHQVRDTVGGTPVLVSFCTVCRTGRVFSPIVDGRVESFRLVGMDHFNAMFEDATTGSWWRQATGEAVAGPAAGKALVELPSVQVTLAQWLAQHPRSLVMQADPSMVAEYVESTDYETGASQSALTGTDTASWHDKSWVVGIASGGASTAYDWNRLRRERVINDVVGGTPIVLVLARDDASFYAFARPDAATRFTLRGDSLVSPLGTYTLDGRGATDSLRAVQASQEFWHSWRTFHPGTTTY